MKVVCGRCKSEYEFDEELISPEGTSVRCTSCGLQFLVKPEAVPATTEPWVAHLEGSTSTREFQSWEDVQDAIVRGQLSQSDSLSRGKKKPRRLADISELRPFFSQQRTSLIDMPLPPREGRQKTLIGFVPSAPTKNSELPEDPFQDSSPSGSLTEVTPGAPETGELADRPAFLGGLALGEQGLDAPATAAPSERADRKASAQSSEEDGIESAGERPRPWELLESDSVVPSSNQEENHAEQEQKLPLPASKKPELSIAPASPSSTPRITPRVPPGRRSLGEELGLRTASDTRGTPNSSAEVISRVPPVETQRGGTAESVVSSGPRVDESSSGEVRISPPGFGRVAAQRSSFPDLGSTLTPTPTGLRAYDSVDTERTTSLPGLPSRRRANSRAILGVVFLTILGFLGFTFGGRFLQDVAGQPAPGTGEKERTIQVEQVDLSSELQELEFSSLAAQVRRAEERLLARQQPTQRAALLSA
ncbi:MAG: zinc-ribbon domain-containing protein, partial [Polyangiaceae bacterium]|nr:zinc-ribbon domain-containing protein [Polyangiaceae bacterium]